MSLLSRSNISSCNFLPLHVGKLLFTDALFERGAVFRGMFLFASPELHETGIIRKHWNRATIYAETKRAHEKHSEIRTLECGLIIVVNAMLCVTRKHTNT